MSKFSIRNMEIPVLEKNKITISEHNGAISIFYGITDPARESEAMTIIQKEAEKFTDTEKVFLFDFKEETSFGSRKWNIRGECNAYENTAATPMTALITDNEGPYELVLWILLMPKN